MPPLNETRFRNDEVVFQLGGKLSNETAALRAASGSTSAVSGGDRAARAQGRELQAAAGPDGARHHPQLQAIGVNFSAQPVYQFEMVQDVAQAPSPPIRAARATRRNTSSRSSA
jgi:hypothetical protein